jgi:hypothetical protein
MKLIKFLFLSLVLFSCNEPTFKYKIVGNVMAVSHNHYSFVPNYDTLETMRPAIAYTDTIYGQDKDSIWYYNSNGSKVTLLAPYKIYKIK